MLQSGPKMGGYQNDQIFLPLVHHPQCAGTGQAYRRSGRVMIESHRSSLDGSFLDPRSIENPFAACPAASLGLGTLLRLWRLVVRQSELLSKPLNRFWIHSRMRC